MLQATAQSRCLPLDTPTLRSSDCPKTLGWGADTLPALTTQPSTENTDGLGSSTMTVYLPMMAFKISLRVCGMLPKEQLSLLSWLQCVCIRGPPYAFPECCGKVGAWFPSWEILTKL